MTADVVTPQTEEQRPEPRVLKSPEWMLTENICAGIGAGFVVFCYPQLRSDTWGSLPESVAWAGVAGGLLCLIRFGIDEIALLLRTIFTQALIASKRASELGGRQKLLHDLRIAIAHADKMEKERNQLQARVSVLEKKKPSAEFRMSDVTWDPSEPDPYRDVLFQDTDEDDIEEDEFADVAPTLELDNSIEQCFADAGALLNHYETFNSLAKGNAYQNSGITARQWERAKQLLLDAGVARIEGNALVPAVSSTVEADVLLDMYREQLATQLHG